MNNYCKWTPMHNDAMGDGNYDTVCGNAHCFIEGDISDNQYKFCPYCGKEIEEG